MAAEPGIMPVGRFFFDEKRLMLLIANILH
jgi:hypothetical protein